MPKESERRISDYQKTRISARSGYPKSWIEIMYPNYFGETWEIVGLLDKKSGPSDKNLDDCASLMAKKFANLLNGRGRMQKNLIHQTPEWKNCANILDNMKHAHPIFYNRFNERMIFFNGVLTPNTTKNKPELHKTTIVKKTTKPFFGYSWNGESYDKVSLEKMSNDYHENNETYIFRIFRLGRDSGDSMGRAKGHPEKINYLAKTLSLYNKKKDDSNWKPIVFAIIAKSSSSHEPVMKIIGKINRNVKRSSNGFSTRHFFFEDICWFEIEDKPKTEFSIRVSNRNYLIASQSQKDLNAYDFLKLFEHLEAGSNEKHSSIMSDLKNKDKVETKVKEIPDDSSSLAPDGTSLGDGEINAEDHSEEQEESIVDKFKNIGKTSEELGMKDETEDDNIDDYDPEQRGKEILAEPIRKLSPELEKKIEECRNELCIDDKYIRQIIHHLASGRHVLIGGAIGTGKSHFVRKFLGKFWATEKSPEGYNIELFTATDEWSTVDVIGGIMPDTEEKQLRYKFQDGCLTKKVEDCIESLEFPRDGYQGDWLAIDEFNRADIEKAFGQLFTAIEDEKLKIPGRRVGNQHGLRELISIPKQFRIIGMMNTSDKHHLYQIHDALKRRFAYVEIETPTRDDKEKEKTTAKNNAEVALNYPESVRPKNSEIIENLSSQMDIAYEMLVTIRTAKGLGTAILKVIYQELISALYYKLSPNMALDWSLTANLLTQFDRVDKKTLEIFEQIFVLQDGGPTDRFAEVVNNREKIAEYREAWKMFVMFVTDDVPTDSAQLDLSLQLENLGNLTARWDAKKTKIKLDVPNGLFARKLRELIENED
ncbi:AAA family ATPase [Candidatus Nitrosopelagicus sp.]|nr:AAA family ATPase [Candidatus Nitrosopelagicus sp.]